MLLRWLHVRCVGRASIVRFNEEETRFDSAVVKRLVDVRPEEPPPDMTLSREQADHAAMLRRHVSELFRACHTLERRLSDQASDHGQQPAADDVAGLPSSRRPEHARPELKAGALRWTRDSSGWHGEAQEPTLDAFTDHRTAV